MGKILSIDLDGTLLDNNKKIPQSTIDYLNMLRKKLNLVVISTGRSINSALDVTSKGSFADYIISDAGALIYDCFNKKVISDENLDSKDCKKVFEDAIINNCKDIKIYTNSNIYKYSREKEYEKSTIIKIDKFEDLGKDIEKITHIAVHFYNNNAVYDFMNSYSNKNEKDKKLKTTRLYLMKDYTSEYVWLDVVSLNINKYFGLLNLLKILKEKESNNLYKEDNIICFGDGSNDFEMMKYSKISVAMGNAFDEIKSVSKYITFTNEEKGVEKWLKEHESILI